jgi:PAS domain S-box-containing protein
VFRRVGSLSTPFCGKGEMSSTVSAPHCKKYRTRQSSGVRQVLAFSTSDASLPGFPAPSFPPEHDPGVLPVSAHARRLLAALFRKFHEFTFEFDRSGTILSIWSSNGDSLHLRRDGPGPHLKILAGQATWSFLRRVMKKHHSVRFHLPLRVARQVRWFELGLYRSRPSLKGFRSFVLHGQEITARRALEDRLHHAEIMLEHAEQLAGMGTWEHDLSTGAVLWSKQLFELHGIDPGQLPANLDEIWRILKFQNTERIRKNFESAVRTGAPFRFTEPYAMPDGSVRILQGLGAPVSDSTGRVVRFVGVTRDVTEHSRTQANLRWLSHQLLTIRNEEQRRVSRELHETTAQTLAALKMTLGQIGRSVPRRNSKVHKLVKTSASLASDAVREVRFVSSFLHPPMLEETGLVTALRSYTKLFAERGGVPVKAEIANDFGRLDPGLELTIFRIVQESLTNVHRHARATSASVRVVRDANSVLVEVKDDGIGIYHVIPDAPAQVSLGVGINGMRERIDQLYGQFDIISAAGAGTTIRALLPIVSKELQHDDQANPKRERRAQTLSDSRRRRSRHRAPRHSRLTGT